MLEKDAVLRCSQCIFFSLKINDGKKKHYLILSGSDAAFRIKLLSSDISDSS